MAQAGNSVAPLDTRTSSLSLYQLLDPEVAVNPYPLFKRLRAEDPVHWDPFLQEWVVTRYQDIVTVFQHFSKSRSVGSKPDTHSGILQLEPVAQGTVQQIFCMDHPPQERFRRLASHAFNASFSRDLQAHIQDITCRLLDAIQPKGRMDIIQDLAIPLPARVNAELLGIPSADSNRLKGWSDDIAELLGNFQHNPALAPHLVDSLYEACSYFQSLIKRRREKPGNDLLSALVTAEYHGDRLTDQEITAHALIFMTDCQKTASNLIGNGLLTLLHHPEQYKQLRAHLSLVHSAIEEMLRYESPCQYTAQLAPAVIQLGDKTILQCQPVVAVIGAANRDPQRFPDPDRFDICRQDNGHIALAYANHCCFSAPLVRIEGQVVIESLLRRMPGLRLEDGSFTRRTCAGLRHLTTLPVIF